MTIACILCSYGSGYGIVSRRQRAGPNCTM